MLQGYEIFVNALIDFLKLPFSIPVAFGENSQVLLEDR